MSCAGSAFPVIFSVSKHRMDRSRIISFFLILTLISGAAGFAFLKRESLAPYLKNRASETSGYRVDYGEVAKTVQVKDAQIVPEKSVDLSFPFAGIVSVISAKEGSSAADGQELLKLDTTDMLLELAQANLALIQSQNNVQKALKGASPEQIAVYAGKVGTHKTTLESAKKSLVVALQDAYARSDDAVRNSADQFMHDPHTAYPTLGFTVSDSTFTIDDAVLKAKVESERVDIEKILNDWRGSSRRLKTTSDLKKHVDSTRKNLDAVSKFMEDFALALNEPLQNIDTKDKFTVWQAVKGNVASSRSSLDEAKATLATAELAWKGGKDNLSVANSDLIAQQSPARQEDLDSAKKEADIRAVARDLVQEKINQASIMAPEGDMILKTVIPKAGEFIQGGAVAVQLVSKNLEVRADVPVEDMAAVAVGQTVSFRPDTVSDQEFHGKIVSIEHAEIPRDGSTYYRIHIALDASDSRLLSGMQGKIHILSSERTTALRVPKNALFDRNGRTFVSVLKDNQVNDTEIITGYGEGDFVEVVSGLKAGDYIKKAF